MSTVKDLEINIPLGNLQAAKVGSYVNVSQYKKLSIAFYSDTTLNLVFTSSHDSVKSGPTNVYTTHPYVWETATIPVFLPFIKLDFEKEDPNIANNELIVIVNGHLKRMHAQHESSNSSEKSNKRRWSSILHASPTNKTKEKEEAPPSPVKENAPISSKDFPALVLPNVLFVGGLGGKIIPLPPGIEGQTLQMTSKVIAWV